jgi:hypothetical protein
MDAHIADPWKAMANGSDEDKGAWIGIGWQAGKIVARLRELRSGAASANAVETALAPSKATFREVVAPSRLIPRMVGKRVATQNLSHAKSKAPRRRE